jgi:hypothetical protein
MKDGQSDFEEVNNNSSLAESDSNGIGYSGGVTNLVSSSDDANNGDAEDTVKSIDISSGCSSGASLLPKGKSILYEAELAQYQIDHDNLQQQEHKTKDDVDSPAGRGGNDDEISYLRRMNVRWKLVIIIIAPTIA